MMETKGGAAGGSNGNTFIKDDLTKEQLECLEATFMKFLTKEMETNLSNWEEFYDLLNETCSKSDLPSSKNNSTLYEKKMEDGKMEEDTSYRNGCTGFKINTEATKQQYKASKSNLKSSFCERKPENPAEQKRKEYNNCGVGNKENNYQFANGNKDEQKDCTNKSSNDKTEELKKTCEPLPKCTKSTKRKNPKGTTRNKTTQQCKDDVGIRDRRMLNNNNQHVNNTIPSENLEFYLHEYYLKCVVIMNYISSTSKMCWRKTKEIILLIFCILLIVVVAIWRVLWFLICFVFKVVLFVVLWVTCSVINCSAAITTKYDILGNIKNFFSHGSDLIFLITGINLKSVFRRKKKDKVDEHEDNSLVPMPTSPEEAVVHLMQTEDKPFKALCVTRQSTNEEIKANYRKMALLVHPDKCLDTQADEAFKVLDSAFKTLTDPEKRIKLMEEDKRRKEWEEFTKRYSNFEEDFETMFNDLINSISCSKCHGKHKRTLVKDRTFYNARYCGDCNVKHSANDGDIWAENSLFGLNWTCYVCMDGEVYELTEWAECQNLRKTIPVNCHRIVCRLGNQPNKPWPNGSNRRRNKQSESSESKRSRKKRRQKGKKP